MKSLGQEEFLRRAREVHGDLYDYSRVKYVNNATPVEIICKIHGSFMQTPAKHMKGRGCTHKDCIAAKKIRTSLERFGTENPMQNLEVQDRLKVSLVQNLGVDNPMKSPEVREKLKSTVRRDYGVDYTCEAESVKAKRIETCIRKYGGRGPMSDKSVRDKARARMVELYGAENALQCDEIFDKMKSRVTDKFGVGNVMELQEIRDRVARTKRERHVGRESNPEKRMLEILISIFGPDDVEVEFSSEKYPYACDYHIKSRDMYIELNAHWSHHDHWFDEDDISDKNLLNHWKSRHTKYYDNCVSVWSGRDVMKRRTARDNNLNYLVFWRNDLMDFLEWVDVGCPDGHDWDHEYSWWAAARPAQDNL